MYLKNNLFLSILFATFVFLWQLGVAKANEQNCVSCHKSAVSDWRQSDHAKAMAIPNAENVLGDFSGVEVSHYSQHATFYKLEERYLIAFTEVSKTSNYQIKYTFGHYPLQQYLIEKAGGRLQVFPFAWDSRTKEQGGQRWYPMYPKEDIQPADRLHWQQPLQNWNGMCADCHSDGLSRNYDIDTNEFDTQWDNINVGCQSCHGKMQNHVKSFTGVPIVLTEKEKVALGQWLLEPNAKIASWQGPKRDNSAMDTCFACHSLRSPITDGFKPDKHFLDQFTPTLLAQPFYHVDGQIKEEVYVYGSFLQSKMYASGVNCMDCHDKHTMKLQTQGNGLCLQCHNAQDYQQESHIRHPLDSDGGQCVSCHMPETVFMGVDFRRDHSFKVPRPDLSATYETPNACNQCHQDKTPQWAAKNIENWQGKPLSLSIGEQSFIDLMHKGYLPPKVHIALINNQQLNVIKRASALAMLPNSSPLLMDADIKEWVSSAHDLIRLAVANIGFALLPEEKLKSYQTLINDNRKAVRVAAAQHLINLGIEGNKAFGKAFKELLDSNQINQWRGEGNLNQSLLYMQNQQSKNAIAALKNGIEVDPFFVENHINLADYYRATNNVTEEEKVFQHALTLIPDSAMLHYSYGMYLIRQQQKKTALAQFKQAIKLDGASVQYAYIYFLALDSLGQTKRAITELKQVIRKYQYPPLFIELGVSFSRKLGDQQSFMYFSGLVQ